MPSVIAFVDEDGSKVAWVFGADGFSALRSLEGVWSSPAPTVKVGDFSSDGGYNALRGLDAIALLHQARAALGLPILSEKARAKQQADYESALKDPDAQALLANLNRNALANDSST